VGRREGVLVEGLDVSLDKLGDAARRIVVRAIDDSRRREHASLGTEHLALAFAEVEWDRFAEIMGELDLDTRAIMRALEDDMRTRPGDGGRGVVVSPAVRVTLKLALHHAARAGRASIGPIDLFLVLLDEKDSGLAFFDAMASSPRC
jgi:ATP-dependent Clp protease ATP-binding subunit ClpA